MIVTNQIAALDYFVDDIATALVTYSRLRWHRSRTGQYGLYEPATAAVPGAAVLLGTKSEPHQINGRTLSFRVNGVATVDVAFTDPDPVSTDQVVAAIAAATPLVVATNASGKLRLTSVLTGTVGSVEILGGDANPSLGFVEGDAAVGKDADTILLSGIHDYFYSDKNGHTDFWYRVEFLHHATLLSSGLGVPFPANTARSVPTSSTIMCYLRLSDLTGFPIVGRRVTFHNPFQPNTVLDGTTRWAVFRHYAQITTDRDGYAEIRLIRGMTLDMSVDGTGFVRRILIPSTGDAVDLFDPNLVVADEFGIQEPDVDFAIRTS